MGLFRKFVNQTRKPEGVLGNKIVLIATHDPILSLREKLLAQANISYARTGQCIYL